MCLKNNNNFFTNFNIATGAKPIGKSIWCPNILVLVQIYETSLRTLGLR